MERLVEYRINAADCAAQATAASEPFKHFYQALELQWRCLAHLAERESKTVSDEEDVVMKTAA